MELTFARAAHVLLTHYKAIQPDAGADQPDQRFDRNDLVELSARERVPSDLKAAAAYLAQPEHFDRLEVSAGIMPEDGYAGKLDVTVAASQRLDYDQAVDLLGAYGEQLDAANGRLEGEFGRGELHSVLSQSDTPADLAEAACYFLAHPHQFDNLAFAARQGMPTDGKVGPADIRAAQMSRMYGGFNY